MGIFDRFENAVERGVNGAFSRVFRSGINAGDVTAALNRAMDDHVQDQQNGRQDREEATAAPSLANALITFFRSFRCFFLNLGA